MKKLLLAVAISAAGAGAQAEMLEYQECGGTDSVWFEPSSVYEISAYGNCAQVGSVRVNDTVANILSDMEVYYDFIELESNEGTKHVRVDSIISVQEASWGNYSAVISHGNYSTSQPYVEETISEIKTAIQATSTGFGIFNEYESCGGHYDVFLNFAFADVIGETSSTCTNLSYVTIDEAIADVIVDAEVDYDYVELTGAWNQATYYVMVDEIAAVRDGVTTGIIMRDQSGGGPAYEESVATIMAQLPGTFETFGLCNSTYDVEVNVAFANYVEDASTPGCSYTSAATVDETRANVVDVLDDYSAFISLDGGDLDAKAESILYVRPYSSGSLYNQYYNLDPGLVSDSVEDVMEAIAEALDL